MSTDLETDIGEELFSILVKDSYDYDSDPDFSEVESYSLSEFASCDILEHKPTRTQVYKVDDPTFDQMLNEIMYRVIGDIEEYLRSVNTVDMSDREIKEEISSKAEELISLQKSKLGTEYLNYFLDKDWLDNLGLLENEEANLVDDKKDEMIYRITRELLGYGNITPVLNDKFVEDISCNGPNSPVYVYHNKYGDLPTNISYGQEELRRHVLDLSQKIGKQLSTADPTKSGRTEDGYRLQLSLSDEISPKGSNFTIRKYKEDPFTPVDLIEFGTFSIDQMIYLWLAIENRKSLIFAGGTAAGKTTSMNAVSMFIPPGSKIVTIEDTQEISLQHSNWVQSVTRESFGQSEKGNVDMYDLLRDGLRQRPEYIIVGEIRGEEARTLFQAMNTGHTTFSTMHADTVKGAIDRLKNEPINVSKQLINALDLVSIQVRLTIDGDIKRRCNQIVEIIGTETTQGDTISGQPAYEYDVSEDRHKKRKADSEVMKDIKRLNNWSDAELKEEMDRRRKVLRYLLDRSEQNSYRDVSETINKYQKSPDELLNKIDNEL